MDGWQQHSKAKLWRDYKKGLLVYRRDIKMKNYEQISLAGMAGGLYGLGLYFFGQGFFDKGLVLTLIGVGITIVVIVMKKFGYPVAKKK